jgi:hypothetical protein
VASTGLAKNVTELNLTLLCNINIIDIVQIVAVIVNYKMLTGVDNGVSLYIPRDENIVPDSINSVTTS